MVIQKYALQCLELAYMTSFKNNKTKHIEIVYAIMLAFAII